MNVTLTDTAAGRDLSKLHDFDVVLPSKQLLIGILPHAVLAGNDEVSEAGNLKERKREYLHNTCTQLFTVAIQRLYESQRQTFLNCQPENIRGALHAEVKKKYRAR